MDELSLSELEDEIMEEDENRDVEIPTKRQPMTKSSNFMTALYMNHLFGFFCRFVSAEVYSWLSSSPFFRNVAQVQGKKLNECTLFSTTTKNWMVSIQAFQAFYNYRHDFASKIVQKIFFLDYQKLFKNK
jgi:hypothetical protein